MAHPNERCPRPGLLPRLALAASVAVALSGCVAYPYDPATGYAYPAEPYPAYAYAGPVVAPTVVVGAGWGWGGGWGGGWRGGGWRGGWRR